MVYTVVVTPKFEKDMEFYRNKRKYKHIQDDLNKVIVELEKGNLLGDPIADINLKGDSNVFKVRAINTDTKAGKSNGYRMIYYVIREDESIFLLTVYYKKEDKNIPSKKEIRDLINQYCI